MIANRQSEISNQKSAVANPQSPARVIAIVLLCLATLAVGHYGWRALTGGEAAGRIEVVGRDQPAPGAADVPLPRGAARLAAMAAPSRRGPRSSALYAVPGTVAGALAFFRARMPAQGWREIGRPAAAPAAAATMLRYSNRAGDWCTISVTEREDGEVVVHVLRVPGAKRD